MDTKPNQNQSPFVRPSSAQSSAKAASAAPLSKPTPSARPVMQSMSSKRGVSGITVVLVLLVMIALGIGVGYGASLVSANTGTTIVPQALNPNAPVKGKIYGNGDPTVFKDTAEGVLKNGGIDGEGQYHLVRPGGDSQNVYMTSSTVDLSKFMGQKVKVWGETQAAQHAGWLMDVGRVEVE